MIKVQWVGGTSYRGRDPDDVLRQMWQNQWFTADPTPEEYARGVRERCRNIGLQVRDGDAGQLLEDLAAHGLVVVEEEQVH